MQKKPEVLTDRQRRFVAEYLTDYNSTRAAIAAGYSKKSARQQGYENLTKPYIQKEIKRVKKQLITDLGITAQRVLLEYSKIAFSDITSVVEFGNREFTRVNPVTEEEYIETVNYVDVKNWDEIDGSLILEVKQNDHGISVKMHDKMKALDALAEYTDLLPDKFKRKIELEKLAMAKEQHKIDKTKSDEGSKGNISEMFASLERAAHKLKGGEADD